jgi:transketolase
MNDLIATRESFGNGLAEINNDKIVVLDADVDSSTKTSYFKEKYPERFIENGIAEADMIGTAAGLATCGKIPVASTFAVFATGRCYDQIRASVAYPKLNVKIVGTHAGVTVGEDGATHQMVEDINLMRGLPNMVVLNPADDVSTRALVKEMIDYNGPVYMRLSRRKTERIYDSEQINSYGIGKGIQFGNGCDCTIFAIGDVLQEALKAKEILAQKGINARVCDMYSIKPIDKELIIKCAKETNNLFTVEDHSIIGGLGSAVSEVLCEKYPKKLVRIGIQDTFGKSGKCEELLEYFGLTSEKIAKTIEQKIEK